MMKETPSDRVEPLRPVSVRSLGERRDHRLEPLELARWLQDREETLIRRWFSEVSSRPGLEDSDARDVILEFLTLLVSFLRFSVGPWREPVDLLWRQTAELYGNVGAMRGLAAGEVIEELQFLRESLIRLLYSDPPGGGRSRVSLREILRLNRFVDRGVTHGSVGHTDALFFSHFQGTGVSETLSGDLLAEIRSQLGTIRAEFEALGGADADPDRTGSPAPASP